MIREEHALRGMRDPTGLSDESIMDMMAALRRRKQGSQGSSGS